MELLIDRVGSPIGTILLVFDDQTLRALDFEDHEDRMHRLLRLHYGSYRLTPGRNPAGLGDRIAAYFGGDIAALDSIPVQTGGTSFQRRVWGALRRIPAGKTTTYGQLARELGVRTRAARSVWRMDRIRSRSLCPVIALSASVVRLLDTVADSTGNAGSSRMKIASFKVNPANGA